MADPADETALIIAVRLPAVLAGLRRRSVPDAASGLPAHATLLYPFAAADALDAGVRARLERVISRHAAFSFRLAGLGRWPGVLYASVEPEDPFRSLYADLLCAFPQFPSAGGRFEFVTHVTIAVDPAASAPETASDPAWRILPTVQRASRADLIVRGAAGWDVHWSFPMRGEPKPPRPQQTGPRR